MGCAPGFLAHVIGQAAQMRHLRFFRNARSQRESQQAPKNDVNYKGSELHQTT